MDPAAVEQLHRVRAAQADLFRCVLPLLVRGGGLPRTLKPLLLRFLSAPMTMLELKVLGTILMGLSFINTLLGIQGGEL